MHSMSLLRMFRKNLGIHLYPPPPVESNVLALSISWRFGSGNVAARKGYKPWYRRSIISQTWSIGDGSGSRRPVRGYNMTTLLTVPCHIAGIWDIVLLEKKIVSKSPIDKQDMWAKDLIHIVFASICKCTGCYM